MYEPIYVYSLCSLWICLLLIIFCERSLLHQLPRRTSGKCRTWEMSMWRICVSVKAFWREFSEDQLPVPYKWKLGNILPYFLCWQGFSPPLLQILFLTTTRHRWQKIRAVQMYIEHLILPLPDNGEFRKGAFRLWKVRSCMWILLI